MSISGVVLWLQLCACPWCGPSSPDQEETEDEGRSHCRDRGGKVGCHGNNIHKTNCNMFMTSLRYVYDIIAICL